MAVQRLSGPEGEDDAYQIRFQLQLEEKRQLQLEEQRQQEQLKQERFSQEEMSAGGDWIPAFPF